MNVYESASSVASKASYPEEAWQSFRALDHRVSEVFAAVEAWKGWQVIRDPRTPPSTILAFVRELYRSVCWYQPHTTEAAFHMIGRFPKGEVRLMQSLACHKAEEAEHGLWAREDMAKLGAKDLTATSPTTFAVAAVWWRMAEHEEPLGYLGAEYLYEQLTALATKAALPIIESRNLPRDELRFVIEHATEDAKHATFLKHLILDTVTRYPGSETAMTRCFDYFRCVWPLPVWEEALERAVAAGG
ncbi:iron-containing redox enzyme family protein [Bradyrhizobium sp. UFLA05-112]